MAATPRRRVGGHRRSATEGRMRACGGADAVRPRGRTAAESSRLGPAPRLVPTPLSPPLPTSHEKVGLLPPARRERADPLPWSPGGVPGRPAGRRCVPVGTGVVRQAGRWRPVPSRPGGLRRASGPARRAVLVWPGIGSTLRATLPALGAALVVALVAATTVVLLGTLADLAGQVRSDPRQQVELLSDDGWRR